MIIRNIIIAIVFQILAIASGLMILFDLTFISPFPFENGWTVVDVFFFISAVSMSIATAFFLSLSFNYLNKAIRENGN